MRKWIVTLLTVLLTAALALPVFANDTLVVDDADLLFLDEEQELTDALLDIRYTYEMDVVVVTTNTLYGKTPRAYADDYYDENGYGYDGVLLLISMEDNDWYISTCGAGITAFNDDGIDYIAEQIVPYFSDGDFYGGFMEFAWLCESFLAQYESGEAYDAGNLPKEPFPVGKCLLGCAIGAAVIALIVVLILKGQLKSVKMKSAASDYVVDGSLQLTQSNEFFLYHTISRVEKPKNNNGTHMSGGGHSHGGGGGKF